MPPGGRGPGVGREDEPIRVLHVDDDPELLELATTLLTREHPDVAVTTAEGAEEGLDALESGSFDCVVSDFEMPGTDGLELLEAVREGYPDLPFVLFTGKGSEEIASEAISAGVTDYLQKRAGREQYTVLANRIENAVDRYRAERAVEETRRWHQRLVEESTDVILVVDTEGTIRYTSPSAEGVLGYDPAETTGRRVMACVHPEDRGRVEAVHAAVVEGESAVPPVRFRAEHADGSWIALESRSRNLLDDPVIEGVVVYVRDVSDRREREHELDRYARLVEATGDAVYTLDREGRYTLVNESWESLTGYDEAEVLGEHVSLAMDGADVERAEALIRELLADDERSCETIEFDVHTRTGERLPVENHLALLTDERGEFIGTTGVLRDVTERRERELELERYARIVGAMGDGVYAMDARGRYTMVNEHMLEINGYDRETVIGAGPDLVHDAEDIERFEAAIADLRTDDDETATVEATLERADGEEVSIEVNLTLLPSPDGEFRGTVGVVRDISERKDREETLEWYETIIEATGDQIYSLNPDGRFTYVNQALTSFWGYDEDELLGEHVSTFMDEADVEAGEELIQELLASDERRTGTYELTANTMDGDRIPTENHLAILTDEAGNFQGSTGVLRDISGRKKREEALTRQNERLDRFASMVSHDLRNPLNVAAGRVQMAQRENDSENLTKAGEALHRMNDIVDDVLTLARQGQRGIETAPTSLATCAIEAWASVEGGDATLAVEDDAAELQADESRLRQLLENLFRNAVEHAGPGVAVRVGRLGSDGSAGCTSAGFYVEDDGPGIPEDERDRVFEYGRSDSAEGTGFGLAIVDGIAQAHGWDVVATGSESGGVRIEVTGVEWVEGR